MKKKLLFFFFSALASLAQANEHNETLLAEARKNVQTTYAQIDWKAYVAEFDKVCSRVPRMRTLNEKTANCEAMREHYEMLSREVQTTWATSFDDYLAQEKTLCELNRKRYSPCGVWKAGIPFAVEKAFGDLDYPDFFAKEVMYCEVKSYVSLDICNAFRTKSHEKLKIFAKPLIDDDVAFKAAYQACYEKSQTVKLDNHSISSGLALVKKDGQCNAVNYATQSRRLNDYTFFKKAMD